VSACPVDQDTALGVVLRGRLVEVVGTSTSPEEAVAGLVEALGSHREGMEGTFQVETSVAWVSCQAACSEPCMAGLVACSEGMASASLAGVVTEDQAEMEEVQSGYCDSGCGRTTAQEDRRCQID
jgi:hypothetical protein